MRCLSLLFALLLFASLTDAQLLPEISEPPGNPTTAEKVKLGKALFWEEQLSSNDQVACGTCHRWEHGGVDPRADLAHPGRDLEFGTDDDAIGSPGLPWLDAQGESMLHPVFGRAVQVTHRQARSPINAAYFGQLFWDGRARDEFTDPLTGEIALEHSAALESQAIEPLMNSAEMAHHGREWSDVVTKLANAEPLRLATSVPAELDSWLGERSYPELFHEAFGDAEITPTRIAMALGAYERTLLSNQAPILLDDEETGFEWTEEEAEGRFLFENLACSTCHPVEDGLFTDGAFHIIGIHPRSHDEGLAKISDFREDRGFFLTPSLLNVELRAPYFHDGSMATLEDVIEFYDRGGDTGPREIAPIGLSARQKAALVAFLKRPLTDPRLVSNAGPFERPRLSTETALPVAVEASSSEMRATGTPLPALVVTDDTVLAANYPGEVSVRGGLARMTPDKAGGTLGRVVLEGGDFSIRVADGIPNVSVDVDRVLAFEDAVLSLENVSLTGELAVLGGSTLSVELEEAAIPGDWSGSGTLRLYAPDDDAFIRRGPALGDTQFAGRLEIARGLVIPTGRDANQMLYASQLVLGSLEGRGWLFRPFEARDFLPDDMPIEVFDGGLSFGLQEDEVVGPVSLYGRLTLDMGRDIDRFRPPTDEQTITFRDCRDASWSDRAEVVVLRWFDGKTNSRQGPDHLVFEGLRDDQLARIRFEDPVGWDKGSYPANRLESGEIVPVR